MSNTPRTDAEELKDVHWIKTKLGGRVGVEINDNSRMVPDWSIRILDEKERHFEYGKSEDDVKKKAIVAINAKISAYQALIKKLK